MEISNKVLSLYASGLSAKDVSVKCGLTESQVYYRLIKSGTPRRSNKINSRRSTINENFFADVNDINAYWIGVIAADGYVGKYRHSSGIVSITQKQTDENYEWLSQYLVDAGSDLSPRRYENETSFGRVRYVKALLTSETMYDDLYWHGITENKSLTLLPPKTMGSFAPHWIRGYFDGDGSASLSGNGVKIRFCGTEEVLSWIAGELPVDRVYWSKRHDDDTNNYQIEVSRVDDLLNTIDYLYKDASRFLPRKRERCESFRAKH